MCGIAGRVSLDGGPADREAVARMASLLAHRGPDGEGLWAEGPVCLGHRRLSILDLSDAGRQPMEDGSGRFVVTFNGEIYNFVELRAELEAAGVRFRSRTDTEVLLEAWARWGPDALPRLNGMFAFALWDRRERVLHAARDRFGEKPFFYRFLPGREFRFASELKALREPGMRFREEVLYRFLAYRQTGTREETFVEGVEQIPPAHRLELRDGRLAVSPYWALPEEPEPFGGSEEEVAARVGELLEDSVRIRMRSDVPLGTCLSGGLDSSTIVALVARLRERGAAGSMPSQAAFTACFPDSPEDETRFVDEVAAATGVQSHRVTPGPRDLLDDLPRLLRAQDEPFSGPSIHAEWKVMELARDRGVTVLLNGQGGDEVFAGYHFYFGDLWWSLLAGGRLGALRREMREFGAVHGKGVARSILRPAVRSRAPGWLRRMKGGPRLPWIDAGFVARCERDHPPRPADLRGSLRESQAHRMLPHLLRQADRSSMAFSREARLPILDHRLVEFVDALPDDRKLRGGTTKWALREAIRGLVPESVRTRNDKVGFALPMAAWMRESLSGAIADTFASRSFRERGVFYPDGAATALGRLAAGDDDAAVAVWNCFLAEWWIRTCLEDGGPR